ncbi:MAG: tail fiber domain-containing protein [Candidatus Cloacimonetes bacterium]|nr:tail fiber domain-containing protein [Candidatus Cloacimonadota bacterium]
MKSFALVTVRVIFLVVLLGLATTGFAEEALFFVTDVEGDTLFAVYPNGVVIKNEAGDRLFTAESDSIRAYVYEDPDTRTSRGGFAIGGVGSTTRDVNTYFQVCGDSVRIYLEEEDPVRTSRGGFAIGGVGSTTRTSDYYFNLDRSLTPEIIDPSQPRMLWYPAKEANRMGRVLVESPDSVGTNSLATGYESKAVGDYSQALGYQTRAGGDYSTAIGYQANAIGDYSFALGDSARALGSDALAIGFNATAAGIGSYAIGSVPRDSLGNPVPGEPSTTATGDRSFAIGLGALAAGIGSFSIGNQTQANDTYALAMGREAVADGRSSVAIGSDAQANDRYAVAIGRNVTADGYASTALGHGTQANGGYSLATNISTQANGYGSTAMGSNSVAGGDYSFASGSSSVASNSYATAMGNNTTASGEKSFAVCGGTTASGQYAFAAGASTIALGQYSTALGSTTQANGEGSIAGGMLSVADGVYSFAHGYQCEASNYQSFAFGYSAIASGHRAISMGDGTVANNTNAVSLGRDGVASGSGSVALGYDCDATNSYSFAAGMRCESTGYASVAMGNQADATGDYSFAVNRSNIASGDYSFAAGSSSDATGEYSFALGRDCTADTTWSMALGRRARTNGHKGTFVWGDGSTTSFVDALADNSFVTRASGGYNLYTNAGLDEDKTVYITGDEGSMGVGNSDPEEKLEVTGDALLRYEVTDVSGVDGVFLKVNNLKYDSGAMSGILFQNGTVADTYKGGIFFRDSGMYGVGNMLFCNDPAISASNVNTTDVDMVIYSGGNVGVGTSATIAPSAKFTVEGTTALGSSVTVASYMTVGGRLRPNTSDAHDLGHASYRWQDIYLINSPNVSSDRRLKERITDLRYGLADLMRLRPVSYQWKNDDEGETHLGLIAQETRQIIPEAVVQASPDDYMGIRYTEIIPVLISAVQEQQEIIKEKDEQVRELESRVNRLEEQLAQLARAVETNTRSTGGAPAARQ